MVCKRCGAEVSGKFCQNCGAELASLKDKEKEEEKKTEETTKDTGVDIEKLLDSYIGSNVKDIKKGGFSWCAFLFGPIYYLYRKMYVEGIIFFLINLVLSYFTDSALGFCVNIYMGLTFKSHYLKHARVKCYQMASLYDDKHLQVLMASRNGGTTIIPVVIMGMFYAGLFVILIAAIITYVLGTENIWDDYEAPRELKYVIPAGFNEREENSAYFQIYETEDKYCSIVVKEGYSDDYKDKGIENMGLNKMSKEDIAINGKYWTYEEEDAKSSTIINMETVEGNREYSISFFYLRDPEHEYCLDSFEQFKNSLNFVDSEN